MSASFQPYTIQDIRNAQLKARGAMPLKDSTSDGTSTFEMARKVYTRSALTAPSAATTTTKNINNNISHPQINHNLLTPAVTNKKWLGNRDASQIIANRRNRAVGQGTLNTAGGPLNFVSNANRNVVSHALSRVRAGGAIAPAKKDANRNNAPTPSFAPAKNKTVYGLMNPTMFH